MVAPGLLALLADGRFPVGGHAHSAGLEAAASVFPLGDDEALWRFVAGRLDTTGVTEAHLVAAVASRLAVAEMDWDEADAEIEARIASPALRSTSRLLGRQWVRAGREVFGAPLLGRSAAVDERGPHQVMAFAALMVDLDVDVGDAVALHLHHLVSTITTAAVRLYGLDPYAAARIQSRFITRFDQISADAVAASALPWRRLPAPAGPLSDVFAERHAVADVRLFRS